VNGVVPLDDDDDLVDQLIAHNPRFRALLRARLAEKAVPAKEAARRL
jgi:hypothetical protein